MNTPIESSSNAGYETTAEAIANHARHIKALASALLTLAEAACNDDEISQLCEAIVLELASITQLQGLELEEILPAETCEECGRPCLDFRRSRATGKATCTTCLVIEGGSVLFGAAAKAARAVELDAVWAQGHESGKRTAGEAAAETRPAVAAEQRHNRATVLDGARQATMQREDHHGAPGMMFARIAELWSVILDAAVLAHHVALCLAALKIARAVEDPHHGDNWVDMAGYAACGGEVALARRSA